MKIKTLLLIVVAAVLALMATATASSASQEVAGKAKVVGKAKAKAKVVGKAKAEWEVAVKPPVKPTKGEGWTPVEPDPATVEPVQPVQPVEPPAAPATPPVEPEPVEPEPVEPEPVEPEAPTTPAEPEPVEVKASNESLTIQVVVQVQRGCRLHCTGTSQTQVAEQVAETVQRAAAGGTAEPDDAVSEEAPAAEATQPQVASATNTSRTVQFIWQAQLGCVAFCYGTTQTQVADQSARTDQLATAAGIAALAQNDSSTSQFVWQHQWGCQSECYENSQSQSIGQSADTVQVAESDASGLDSLWQAELTSLQSWATNFGATIQVVTQFQDASCEENCVGDSQTQTAVQQAQTAQEAAARAADTRHRSQDGVSAPA